jgi:hypothetical protein
VLPLAILVALCVLLDPGMIQAATLRESLLLQLLPPESNELANVVLEIRSSVGGDWAGDFAADLLEMYRQFAGQQGWRFEVRSDRWASHGGELAVRCFSRKPALQSASVLSVSFLIGRVAEGLAVLRHHDARLN